MYFGELYCSSEPLGIFLSSFLVHFGDPVINTKWESSEGHLIPLIDVVRLNVYFMSSPF